MRVLHFYKSYYPDNFGGVEQAIFQLVSGCKAFGINSSVLSLTSNPDKRVDDFNDPNSFRCRTLFRVASTDFSIDAFGKFKELTKQVDIINYHYPWPFMDIVHFMTYHKKPTIVTYHSDIIRQNIMRNLYNPLKNIFFNSVDAIVATSPNYFATSPTLKRFQKKVEVIPIGLDKKLYPHVSQNKTEHWKRILGSKFFLFVGVLRYYKGLNILLDALAMGDMPTVIVGAGPIENELRKKAVSLGLKNLTFLGQVSDEDKVAILNLSYAVLFPSNLRSEAFGISLLEGAMYGKPMISCEIGTGTSFINCNQHTGIVIPRSSPKDLYEAMSYLWNSPRIATKMGHEASIRFEKFFRADKMCKEYAKLYNRIISEKYNLFNCLY